MWNTFVDELTTQNGAGLEMRILFIIWIIIVLGALVHFTIKITKNH